jgi:predicted dinucleotide-binding enzyme
MRIAIVGAGRVGTALAGRWSAQGHDLVLGVRRPGASDGPPGLPQRLPSDAVEGADVAVLAVPWSAAEEVATTIEWGATVLVDATNPLVGGGSAEPAGPSGGELVARWSGSDRVVKAFNTTGSGNMVDPSYGAATPLMPVAGDDPTAKAVVMELAREIGFDALDAGPLSAAADLEHLAALWIRLAYPLGLGPDIAFALLRRPTPSDR